MPTWICNTCGQRIRRARDGWLSGTRDADGRATIALVHHAAASPWALLGGCCPPDEQASVHLPEALRRDACGIVQGLLDAVGKWDMAALETSLLRLHGTPTPTGARPHVTPTPVVAIR
jgi:hypothetical protein